ncbi:irregular chiasm C-roughest protein-like [Neocloeon triangulifer]|uniref:irregular chiasm C-roughest protein-like n=1 Tax=Neocloeon triangulifer TaxID=2078957 RepID=UPI00286F6B46|nr:irregular chiasm C-roughest protein-like [Neocloeon triangulifer]XP_059484779.1 irregular chiasm C-roughest protein-like [Neocloeon triangulifer]XP_059484780.1 irregular chiasm C-roughest protein-like [Neocloeon triangulifer]XP_059484781.1 irregular chiasm C-roughest protein-like [Neocloeon triangulifer]XP_059484782.1 irregular chiasm C-roughest protein-like [Neocloeon triangulifer]XP_059484783.1 irregular chiasm C-roughest protein-like [Neocloeon triangulifer]XP_059484784.1 irregular chia
MERSARTTFLTLLLALLVLSGVQGLEQKFAIEPMDQTAIVGSRVTLPCRVENKRGILQWTRDSFALGANRDLSHYPRYTMIGSDEEGDYSLDISHVNLEDDAQFECQVAAAPGVAFIRSRKATLTVLVPPDAPEILQGRVLTTTEDREIELECVSRGGKPSAEITWLDGQGNVITSGIETVTEPLPDGKRVTAKSILKLIPKKEHHGQNLTCQAQNTADRNHRSARLRLDVKFAPKVSVRVTHPEDRRIVEGDEVKLACKAEANPTDGLNYRWYINDEPVSGEYTTELLIPNVTRSMHDTIAKCEVRNVVGKSEESETLDIAYGPRFKDRPKSVQAENGAQVTLSCDVDSNPAAVIRWLHGETSKVISSSNNLSLTVSSRTAGRYICVASTEGFSDIKAEAQVYLKGPPDIISRLTQYGSVGETVKLECVVFSVPRPDRVAWSRNGREVHAALDPDVTINEEPLPEGIKSTLVIRGAQSMHFGAYNCSASNAFGTDVAEINLRIQDGLKNLEIIFYVALGAVVLVLFVACICFCRCRTNQKNLHRSPPQVVVDMPEKSAKLSDRSSNDSDLKVDIRTSSSLSNVHEDTSDRWEDRSDVPTPRLTNGGEGIYRYSADYTEPSLPLKTDGANNNGYVPFVDYSREYNPPLAPPRNNYIDPQYSATYGNRFARASPHTTLPTPAGMTSPPGRVSSPPLQPPPPAYSATVGRNGSIAAPLTQSRMPSSNSLQFIQATGAKRGNTLATHV